MLKADFLKTEVPLLAVFYIFFTQNCSFGYHAGGWGKPPVDETGKPLYGDVFGTNAVDFQVRRAHTHTLITSILTA